MSLKVDDYTVDIFCALWGSKSMPNIYLRNRTGYRKYLKMHKDEAFLMM